jgi:hypothetical protein
MLKNSSRMASWMVLYFDNIFDYGDGLASQEPAA